MNSTDPKERAPQVEMLLGVFKYMAQNSNQNLSRNVDYLLVKENSKSESMEWSVDINILARDDEGECAFISQ